MIDAVLLLGLEDLKKPQNNLRKKKEKEPNELLKRKGKKKPTSSIEQPIRLI